MPTSRRFPTRTVAPAVLLPWVLLVAGACGEGAPPASDAEGEPSADGPVAFTGATVWDGAAAEPLAGATLVVDDGRVVSLEADGVVPPGAREVDLSGHWIVPGLIDTHAHVTGRWAPDSVAGAEARLESDLLLFARYGVTTVSSLGGAPAGAAAVRAAQEGGAPGRARLLFAGEVVTGPTAEEARAQVAANAGRGADWIKLRVDDNLGTTDKMPWEAVEATLDEAEARGLPVATHVFYLEDARRLLEMGTGMVAHSVRDVPVPPSFAGELRGRGVCYVPTLTREVSTFTYADPPPWLDDPFFLRWAPASEVEAVRDPDFRARMAESPMAAGYREALVQAQANLATLVEAGAPVAFGTDAGPPARFPGWMEHLELELMVEAGLTPLQALRSATSVAADCLGLQELGVLEAGRHADFLVLGADPLEDVTATRTLEAVYVGGEVVR